MKKKHRWTEVNFGRILIWDKLPINFLLFYFIQQSWIDITAVMSVATEKYLDIS